MSGVVNVRVGIVQVGNIRQPVSWLHVDQSWAQQVSFLGTCKPSKLFENFGKFFSEEFCLLIGPFLVLFFHDIGPKEVH